MVGPLKIIVDLSGTLINYCDQYKLPSELKKIATTIQVSSKLVLFHSNDLLDQRIIQNGSFTPNYTHGSMSGAIEEIMTIVRFNSGRKDINIKCDTNVIRKMYSNLLFDKRRFQ